jgi:putative ABC transport system permease protein
MIKNYFKIAWRNLKRYKGYSLINITGLAVGIASCLLLFMVVNYELGYDHYQKKFKNIYRVVSEEKYSDGNTYNPGVPIPLLETMRTKFPQIEVAALNTIYGSQVTIPETGKDGNDKKFIEPDGIFFMEPQFFDIFSFRFLSGNASVLKDPGNVILTKSIAEKYFSNWQQAIGKTIKLDNLILLKVAAILENGSAHTDIPVRVAVSFESLKKNPEPYNFHPNWGGTSSNFQVYTLLPPNVTGASINSLLLDFSKKQYHDDNGSKRKNFLQPLSEIHFDTRFGSLGDHVTTKATLRTLVLIGLLILVMASINFVNLSTAQAIGRSKEVGVRKVLGGSRLQLFWQMMGETGLIVLFALVLALTLAKLALPFIKHVASVQEALPLLSASSTIFVLALLAVVTLFSGLYPSLILSGFKPALALKNKITSASVGGISLRRGLVVMQFAISQILVIGTIVAITQMNFVRNADLGFNKDAIYLLNLSTDSVSLTKQVAFREDLLKIPGVTAASFASDVPSSDNNWGTNFAFDHGKDQDFNLYLKFGDENYVVTYGLKLLAGKNFNKSDTMRELLINTTLAQKLGLKNPKDAVGKTIRVGGGPFREIVGVVKDFNTNSLRDAIKPLVISSSKKFYGRLGIKLHGSGISAARESVEKTFSRYYPDYAFDASFVDENIAQFYKQEDQLSLLYKIFAGLAIFISCLGLYGLVSFMAVQKTKEVGIRKVLGATVSNIVYLFSKEFTLLIMIAFLIAVPVAYYMMNSWLNNFVYRIPIGAGIFLLAVVISIVIAWLTVGYKAVKAAVANPVKSLKEM